MSIHAIIKTIGIASSLAFIAKLASAAIPHPTPPARLWVQYQSGQKHIVRDLLMRSGAIFHYDFSDLESFVVTLPETAIERLAQRPEIADYWYASMMSKNEPVLQEIR